MQNGSGRNPDRRPPRESAIGFADAPPRVEPVPVPEVNDKLVLVRRMRTQLMSSLAVGILAAGLGLFSDSPSPLGTLMSVGAVAWWMWSMFSLSLALGDARAKARTMALVVFVPIANLYFTLALISKANKAQAAAAARARRARIG